MNRIPSARDGSGVKPETRDRDAHQVEEDVRDDQTDLVPLEVGHSALHFSNYYPRD